jgi:hypothetical protein
LGPRAGFGLARQGPIEDPASYDHRATLALLAGCAASDKADLYQPPPNDGSVNANSADVIDNPGIVSSPDFGAKPGPKQDPNTYKAPPNDGSVNANSADVVDNPGIVGVPVKAGAKPKWVDPISKEPVKGEGHVGYYGQWPVHFENGANAAQWASLPKAKRAKLAAPQVLPQKKITNHVCPLTGAELDAAAAPVTWDGAVIGFASSADANQFRALKKEKQDRIIAAWRADGSK